MRKILLSVCAGMVLFASCSKKDSVAGTTSTTTKSTTTTTTNPTPASAASVADTTYVLSGTALTSLTTDPHQVLVEWFSGQSCANCPRGNYVLDTMCAAHAGHINYIALYETGGGSLTTPPPGSVNDFESSIAYNIGIYPTGSAVGEFPSAFVDRVPDVSDGILIFTNNWPSDITERMSNADSVNLSISSTYSGTTATITVLVTYTQPVPFAQNLTLDLVEDSIYDFQSDNRTGIPHTDTNYLFTNVFRDMITASPGGDIILDNVAVKERGRVYKHTYTYTLPTITGHPAINPAHCRVVGFVSMNGAGGNFEIMQSAQTKLMGP